MDEKKLTQQESLDLIVQMINHAQVNVQQSSFHLLLWGWIIALASFTNYYLVIYTDVPHPYAAWLLTIPGIFISFIYGFIKGKQSTIHTYADRLYFLTWMAYLISIILIQVFFYDTSIIGVAILVLTGNTVFISGLILKFRPLLIGGVVFWVASIAGHVMGDETTLLLTGISVIFGYLLPGYLLKRKGLNDSI